MMSDRSRHPFTAAQWQELEHQALIFKYMVSGIPVPPDLLFTIKRSMGSSLPTKLFSHQTEHIGWNCIQMGLGRKVDPEPGRCRRTDGKKWRCSKEAYPDSKYCERHMHRGKSRSRKPVEVITPPPTNPSTPSSILSITKNPSSSLTSDVHQHHRHDHPCYSTHLHHSLYSPHPSSSRPPGIDLSSQDNTTHLHLNSGCYSQTDPDYRNRYADGLKTGVDEYAFFSEASGSTRSYSGTSLDDSWQLKPQSISCSSKQSCCSGLQNGGYSYLQLHSHTDTNTKQNKQDQHCYILGSNLKSDMAITIDSDDQPQRTVHRFLDDWTPKNRDSWLNLDDKSSNSSTQLSISIPTTSHVFPIFSSRTQNDC